MHHGGGLHSIYLATQFRDNKHAYCFNCDDVNLFLKSMFTVLLASFPKMSTTLIAMVYFPAHNSLLVDLGIGSIFLPVRRIACQVDLNVFPS